MRLAPFQKAWLRTVLEPSVNSAVLSLPRGNGKSTFLAGLALWALFDADAEQAPQVAVVATTVTQAVRACYGVALAMVDKNPELKSRSIKYMAIGATKLVCPVNGGEMFPVSNDIDGLQGLDPSMAVVDEIGFQPIESWDSLLLAGGKRPRSLVVGIGTPGYDKNNALYHLRSLSRSGAVLPGFSYTEYSADAGCALLDETQWAKANPALADGFLGIDALRTAVALSPEASFRVFRLGQWVDGVESWLGVDGRAVWDSLETSYSLVSGEPAWVGVDIGIKRDSTAVVTVQYKPDGKLHAFCKLWIPTTDEPVDATDVMQYLRDLCDTYRVGAISYDPRFFDVPAKMLYDDGLPMVEVPQSVERMTPIIGNVYELIKSGDITHDKDVPFSEQVLNAIPRFNERGFTLKKNQSRGRIDGAIALSLAVDRAQHKTKPRPAVVVL